MSNLAEDIANAHKQLRRTEMELLAAKSAARTGKKRVANARGKLDALLDELASGQTQLPLFDRPEPDIASKK